MQRKEKWMDRWMMKRLSDVTQVEISFKG